MLTLTIQSLNKKNLIKLLIKLSTKKYKRKKNNKTLAKKKTDQMANTEPQIRNTSYSGKCKRIRLNNLIYHNSELVP